MTKFSFMTGRASTMTRMIPVILVGIALLVGCAVRPKALGPDHSLVAKSLNNLGLLMHYMGDYAGARPLYERALAIREKA